jgi:hypothetical protein
MTATLPLRIELSNTYRGIFVMRYLLFSGGLAIAGGVLERLARGPGHSLLGLLLGLVVGLFLFRGQLRPLRYPRLALSQDALYVLKSGSPVGVPWRDIGSIQASGDKVLLELTKTPPGLAEPRLQLVARELGSQPDNLASRLSRFHRDEAFRANLSDDKRTRAVLGL